MNPFEFVKGLYNYYTIKAAPITSVPAIIVPKKPRLQLDIDVNGSRKWIGVVWHHSFSSDNKLKDDAVGIIQYHMSFRINFDSVASPVEKKEPGIEYILYPKNNKWYKKSEYDYWQKEYQIHQVNKDSRVFEVAWSNCGYHGITEYKDEQLAFHWGRSLSQMGAHAGHKTSEYYNQNYIGLCCAGNYDVNPVAPDMWNFNLMLTRSFMDVYGFGTDNVLGHREVYVKLGVPVEKQCPGKNWNMDSFRKEL